MKPSTSWAMFERLRDRRLEVRETLDRINIEKLEATATKLRHGIECRVNTSSYAFGGVNLVLEIDFGDDVIWIARIQLLYTNSRAALPEIDKTVDSEAATLRFLKTKTSIPVPAIYGYDARHDNEIGAPYLIMEAMPGNRLWGGGRTDFIPEKHKAKVYMQIADILIQLYSQKFSKIGMLYRDDMNDTYCIGEIVDQHKRIQPYGPFDQSLDFYQTRACLLYDFHGLTGFKESNIDMEAFKVKCVPSIVDHTVKSGPFYLTHPDFQVLTGLWIERWQTKVSNFLFDDDYNITGLLDWSGCQTAPLESFAHPPQKIIEDAEDFLDECLEWMTHEEIKEWVRRRQWFLKVMEEQETTCGVEGHQISKMMRSQRSYFASVLDAEGVGGFTTRLEEKYFNPK
jgi:isoamyl acetate esterase